MKSYLTLIFINILFDMLLNMNKLIITIILLLLFSNTYSQEKISKLPKIKSKCPMVIINNFIISNEDFIKKNEGLITQISIIKDKPNRKEHNKFYNLTKNGIVFVQLEKKIKYKTQCELNNFFGLHKENKIHVNGYLIENLEYKIAIESITEIELILPNSINKLKQKLINVWTLTKKEQLDNCQK